MAHDKNKIFEQTKKLIVDKNLFFIEDIISYLPISKPTFYSYFPIDSNEFNTIKELIDKNKVSTKALLMEKWFKSDAPALQIGLMKLIATDEQAHRLNGTKTVNQTEISGEIKQTNEVSYEQAKEIQKKLDEQV
jgi:hypothetical protein